MNLMKPCVAAAVAVTLSTSAMGQTTRVAYVDIDTVTAKSDKINKAMGSVEDRVKGIQESIETKRQRLVDVKADIKKGDGVLADSELKKKRDEATKIEKELVDLEYEGRREMQKLDSTLFEPMVKTIQLAIQDVAKERNIDLVVRGEAVIYGAPAADITEAVIKKLNSSSYNPGAAPAKEETDDKTSTSSSETEKKSENGGSTDSANLSQEAKPAASTAKTTEDESGKKPIFPVPLVTRPVDRQQD